MRKSTMVFDQVLRKMAIGMMEFEHILNKI